MQVSSTAVTSGTQSQASLAQNSLSPDDFLKLLIAELQNQDPLDPMDTQGLMAQLSQLDMVAESRALRQSQDMSQAIALIGRTAYWQDPATGATQSGQVTSVLRNGSEAVVVVGDKQLKLGEIMAIS